MADIPTQGGTEVNILSGDGNSYYAKVDASGNLNVVNPGPVPPEGTTGVTDQYFGSLSGTDNSYYTIPTGEEVTIQRLKSGCQADSDGNQCALYYAPNGDLTGLVLIEVIFSNGASYQVDLSYTTPIGNGKRAILLQTQRLTGGAISSFSKWEGYY